MIIVQESGNQENKIVRYVMTIGCGFVESGYTCMPMSRISENMKDILSRICSSTNNICKTDVFFEPVIYQADSPNCSENFVQTFGVTNLNSLADLLNKGVKVSIYVSELVYVKIGQYNVELPSVSRKHLSSSKSTKSGRTSAQSGASSATKVCFL